MKYLTFLFTILTVLTLGTSNVFATDPACVGVSQSPTVDFSDGNGTMCFPETLVDGTIISNSKILSCTITFLDNLSVQIGTQVFTGGPGTAHIFNVPRDGTGTAEAVCTLDGNVSDRIAGTVQAIYPVNAAPSNPITLP